MHHALVVLIAAVALGLLGLVRLPGQSEEEELTIFVTGADHGILEPCGCTGGQLGGIGRRASFFEAFTYGDKPRLILATGGLPGGIDTLQVIRYETILLCLGQMEYDAVGVGTKELALGLESIRYAQELVEFPFILSNVSFPGEEESPFQPFLVKEVGSAEVRILSIIPESLIGDLPQEAAFIPPAQSIRDILEQTPDAELTVVLMNGTRSEAKALDPLLPDPKLIFYSYPHSESRIYDFGMKEGLIRYLSPGDRARFVVYCGLARNADDMLEPKNAVEEPLVLDLYPESDSVETYMIWYKDRVIGERILDKMVGQKPAPQGSPYVGNETCALCHEAAYRTWAESGHAHAYETLVKAGRDYDPECLSCHTVGFEFKTGFRSVEETPHLLDVGCESCHGPGRDHVSSGGLVPTPLKVECASCHDLDHSSSFDEKEYWAMLTCTADPKPSYTAHGK